MDQQERCKRLIDELLKEMPEYADTPVPALPDRRWRLLRSLMNVRPPMPADEGFLRVQDDFLRQMTAEKGVVDAAALEPSAADPRVVLWQGDITRLSCGAIVNAANSQLLGCFSPCHGCIDNIIHTMAGIQLRLACHEIMRKQRHEEPAGRAKITPGFNLPARYVLHSWRRKTILKVSLSAVSQPVSLCFRIRGQPRSQWKPFGTGWTRPEAG